MKSGSKPRRARFSAWRRVTALCACLPVVVFGVGCQAPVSATAASAALRPIVLPVPHSAPSVIDARGSIVGSEPLSALPEILTDVLGDGRRATYRSVSGVSGAGTEVTGAFLTPKGAPPAGGWPVISLAHGYTGLKNGCGPSVQADFAGYAGAVASLLAGGYAVAMSDYEGLGPAGFHPFLEPRTAAMNVIDAVRALRFLYPDVSDRWAALGVSQGGQASWAANELNPEYGAGLAFVGSVALAPAANMSGLAELAYQRQLSAEQRAVLPLFVVTIQRLAPGGPVDHLLHGRALEARNEWGVCTDESNALLGSLTAEEMKPASREDADALSVSLRKLALPRARVSAPMFVVSGLEDGLIPAPWIKASVGRSCELGGDIEYLEVEGAGHADVVPDETVMQWIADRFSGKPAPTNCKSE